MVTFTWTGFLSPMMFRNSPIIVVAPLKEQPFLINARVYEEDTFLVLSPPQQIISHWGESLSQLLDASKNCTEIEPGQVLLDTSTKPLQLRAVVHDLSRDPTCREEWIQSAYTNIFSLCIRKRIKSIGIPLLGTHHGSFPLNRSFELFQESLNSLSESVCQKIWIISDREPVPDYFTMR